MVCDNNSKVMSRDLYFILSIATNRKIVYGGKVGEKRLTQINGESKETKRHKIIFLLIVPNSVPY